MTTIAFKNTDWYINDQRSRVNQSYPFEFEGAKDDPQTYTRLKELTSVKNP